MSDNKCEWAKKPVLEIINAAADERFWGTLELKFEAGVPVLLKKTQTFKPEEYQRNNRSGGSARP